MKKLYLKFKINYLNIDKPIVFFNKIDNLAFHKTSLKKITSSSSTSNSIPISTSINNKKNESLYKSSASISISPSVNSDSNNRENFKSKLMNLNLDDNNESKLPVVIEEIEELYLIQENNKLINIYSYNVDFLKEYMNFCLKSIKNCNLNDKIFIFFKETMNAMLEYYILNVGDMTKLNLGFLNSYERKDKKLIDNFSGLDLTNKLNIFKFFLYISYFENTCQSRNKINRLICKNHLNVSFYYYLFDTKFTNYIHNEIFFSSLYESLLINIKDEIIKEVNFVSLNNHEQMLDIMIILSAFKFKDKIETNLNVTVLDNILEKQFISLIDYDNMYKSNPKSLNDKSKSAEDLIDNFIFTFTKYYIFTQFSKFSEYYPRTLSLIIKYLYNNEDYYLLYHLKENDFKFKVLMQVLRVIVIIKNQTISFRSVFTVFGNYIRKICYDYFSDDKCNKSYINNKEYITGHDIINYASTKNIMIVLVLFTSYHLEVPKILLETFKSKQFLNDFLNEKRKRNFLEFLRLFIEVKENKHITEFIKNVSYYLFSDLKETKNVRILSFFKYNVVNFYQDLQFYDNLFRYYINSGMRNSFNNKIMIEVLLILRVKNDKADEIYEKYSWYFPEIRQVKDFNYSFKLISNVSNNSKNYDQGLQETLINKALTNLNYKTMQQLQIAGFISIDFLINDNIILNINGSSHYTTMECTELNNISKLRSNILRFLGYSVIDYNLLDLTNSNNKNKNNIEWLSTHLKKVISDAQYKNTKIELS